MKMEVARKKLSENSESLLFHYMRESEKH